MTRRLPALLPVALLAAAAFMGPAHAQYADPRAATGYDDGPSPGPQYQESYGSADARTNGDPRDAAPPPPHAPRGNAGYGSGGYDTPPPGWQQPAPYAHEGQVDEGRPDDAAHRADRAYTTSLNRRPWPRRNASAVAPGGAGYSAEHARYKAELAEHARAMQAYQAEQARYADRYARWQAQASACQAGDAYACNGPQ